MRKLLVSLLFASFAVATLPTNWSSSGSGRDGVSFLAPQAMTVDWWTNGWWTDPNGPPYTDPYEAWYLTLGVNHGPANTLLQIEFSITGDESTIEGSYTITTDGDGYVVFTMDPYATFHDPVALPWATTSWSGVIRITDVGTGNVLYNRNYTTEVEYMY